MRINSAYIQKRISNMQKIAVIGAGSWGTALAFALANNGHDVRLTTVSEDHIEAMVESNENAKYFPGLKFPENLRIARDNGEAMDGVSLVVFAAPAQKFRTALEHAAPFLTRDMIMVNVAKGIELGTLLRISEIAHILRRDVKFVTLSGPSHAEEVVKKLPTTLVVSSKDRAAAELVQKTFMSERLRVYTNDDIIGVELGGALKNIIALGAGISDGIGYGDNAKAALMTRGIVEITRLGIKLGAKAETFSGLSGIGDLIVTCCSDHSRNRQCGIYIGQGMKPDDAISKVGMVVEGAKTAKAASRLAKRHGVDMPITECICECLDGKITAQEAVDLLMGRKRKSEKV